MERTSASNQKGARGTDRCAGFSTSFPFPANPSTCFPLKSRVQIEEPAGAFTHRTQAPRSLQQNSTCQHLTTSLPYEYPNASAPKKATWKVATAEA